MKQEKMTLKQLKETLRIEIMFLSSPDAFRKFLKLLTNHPQNSVGDIASAIVAPPLLALKQGVVEKSTYFFNLGIYCVRLFAELGTPLGDLVAYYLILARNLFREEKSVEAAFDLPEYAVLRKYIAALKNELQEWPELEN